MPLLPSPTILAPVLKLWWKIPEKYLHFYKCFTWTPTWTRRYSLVTATVYLVCLLHAHPLQNDAAGAGDLKRPKRKTLQSVNVNNEKDNPFHCVFRPSVCLSVCVSRFRGTGIVVTLVFNSPNPRPFCRAAEPRKHHARRHKGRTKRDSARRLPYGIVNHVT